MYYGILCIFMYMCTLYKKKWRRNGEEHLGSLIMPIERATQHASSLLGAYATQYTDQQIATIRTKAMRVVSAA